MMEQQQPREWSAEVKREPKKPGEWFEEYIGNGEYRFVQYQKEARQ